MFVFADRIKETTNTTGLGAVTLGGAVPGFRTFLIGVGNTNSTFFTIAHDTDNTWEVGIGTVSGITLTRDSVLSSSSGGSPINFGTGTKTVFSTIAASHFNDSLTTANHAVIDHTGIPGVLSAETLSQTDHLTEDHTGITGVLSVESFDDTAHSIEDHTGILGVPGTATSGSGGGTEGAVTADEDKGLLIAGGVMEAKIGAGIAFTGGAITATGGYTMQFTAFADDNATTYTVVPSLLGFNPQDAIGHGITVPSEFDGPDGTDAFPAPAPGDIVRVVTYFVSDSEDTQADLVSLSLKVNGIVVNNILSGTGSINDDVLNVTPPVSIVPGDKVTFNMSRSISTSNNNFHNISLLCFVV